MLAQFRVDPGNPVVGGQNTVKTLHMREVVQTFEFIVGQINCIVLILHQMERMNQNEHSFQNHLKREID